MDLIDRQAAIDEAYAVIVDDAVYDVVQVETLEGLPSVDAVEVVRCADCKHKYLESMVWVCPFGLPGSPDSYCSYGERKNA